MRDVRRFVVDVLGSLPVDRLEEIVLMSSELAANAVRHAATSYSVTIDRAVRSAKVTVRDAGGGEPTMRRPSPLDPSGRGLLIVDALSHRWGTTPRRSGGKSVWFVVGTPTKLSSWYGRMPRRLRGSAVGLEQRHGNVFERFEHDADRHADEHLADAAVHDVRGLSQTGLLR